MKTPVLRLSDVRIEIEHEDELCVKVEYTCTIEKNSITKGITVPEVLEMCLPELSLDTETE